MLTHLPHQLLAGAGQIPQLLDRRRWYEARPDQPMRQQVGNPRSIVHVGLAARYVLDVSGVGEHQRKSLFQNMPNRFPVHTRSFHRDVRASAGVQPFGQAQQSARRRAKTAHLLLHRRRYAAHAGHHHILVYIETPAAGIQYFHGSSSWLVTQRRAEPSSSKSTNRAPERNRSWQQFGVLAGFGVQLLIGLLAPRINRPLSQRRVKSYQPNRQITY